MGLFTKKTTISDPLKQEKKQAGQFLTDLMSQGTPDLPTQKVSGLTDTQRRIQAGVSDRAGDLSENYRTAKGYLTDVISDQYDPRTSDYYRGLREEAGDLKTEAQTDIRQGANLGGMLMSTPRGAIEAESNRKYDRNLLTQLGGMYETERGRKADAVEGLSRLDASTAATSGNLQAIADLERQIDQQRNKVVYDQALQTVMFPYTYQTQIANAIFGGSQPIVTGGGMTDLGFALSTGASAAGGFIGAKAAG